MVDLREARLPPNPDRICRDKPQNGRQERRPLHLYKLRGQKAHNVILHGHVPVIC